MKARVYAISPYFILGLVLFLASGAGARAGDRVERVRNDKVQVVEETLAPGEALSLPDARAGVVVYLNAGTVAAVPYSAGLPVTNAVRRGETGFQPSMNEPAAHILKNAGSTSLRLVWTAYLGTGKAETWGHTGLAPDYKVLFENQYGRVYDIRVAAGKSEPLHSHHNRVVVCLSGAELEHILPDGRKQTASLKTGEVGWRPAATHVGHNLGRTDLWVIAIEPK